jgi:hypothetical protein
MINLQRMSQTEIIEGLEGLEKIKSLIKVVDGMPNSKLYKSFINYDSLLAIRKILGVDVFGKWDKITDTTLLKRKLKKANVII